MLVWVFPLGFPVKYLLSNFIIIYVGTTYPISYFSFFTGKKEGLILNLRKILELLRMNVFFNQRQSEALDNAHNIQIR